EYSYGKDKRIVTSLELDEKFKQNDPLLEKIENAAFIQCVGSREPGRMYCSRVCCTHSIENAIWLKQKNPDMNVYILYRDIRTYGEKEYLYKQARQEGVIFIRYSLEDKPRVEVRDKSIAITVTDHVLNRPVELNVDLLTLATAIVPVADEKLANFFKVPMNEDGFFIERHAKLGPAEFATDGVYLCGMAHYPKPIDESIAQAKAAVSRAVTLLSRTSIFSSGTIAQVDPIFCASCGVCVSICPYNAPSFAEEGRNAGKAQINPALCKGCGLCVASCRSGAIHLKGFDTDQIMSQIFELNEAI
ncbi:MAG: CoB--CoM heterodisulfide reductase iron-sulfur subunit A family protein, partial [Desulfobacterales bacterium]